MIAYAERENAAWKNGKYLTVVGDPPLEGTIISPSILYIYDSLLGKIVTTDISHFPKTGYILYSVNSFVVTESLVCKREAKDCDEGIFEKAKRFGIALLGVSNDDSVELFEWQQQAGIKNHPFYTGGPDFSRNWGVHIKEYQGQYQRAAWAVLDNRIVASDIVFDQGEPIPDFQKLITAIVRAKPRLGPNTGYFHSYAGT